MKEEVLEQLYVLERDLLDQVDVREEIEMLLIRLEEVDPTQSARARGRLLEARRHLVGRMNATAAVRELGSGIREVKSWED